MLKIDLHNLSHIFFSPSWKFNDTKFGINSRHTTAAFREHPKDIIILRFRNASDELCFYDRFRKFPSSRST